MSIKHSVGHPIIGITESSSVSFLANQLRRDTPPHAAPCNRTRRATPRRPPASTDKRTRSRLRNHPCRGSRVRDTHTTSGQHLPHDRTMASGTARQQHHPPITHNQLRPPTAHQKTAGRPRSHVRRAPPRAHICEAFPQLNGIFRISRITILRIPRSDAVPLVCL